MPGCANIKMQDCDAAKLCAREPKRGTARDYYHWYSRYGQRRCGVALILFAGYNLLPGPATLLSWIVRSGKLITFLKVKIRSQKGLYFGLCIGVVSCRFFSLGGVGGWRLVFMDWLLSTCLVLVHIWADIICKFHSFSMRQYVHSMYNRMWLE